MLPHHQQKADATADYGHFSPLRHNPHGRSYLDGLEKRHAGGPRHADAAVRGRGAQLAQGGAAQGLDVGLVVEQGVEEVVALDVNGVADVGVVGLEQTPFLAGGVRQGTARH